ncbi:hypothetical protein AC482_01580 [miscellaneous Crenarchaeota group-15 archaeon DG-45]|uniref:Uncharacterized protein n=1 Tax=miscellaneous Crenarchaeota group-15 archaeon DG-45 TaxID=1685127 RepID=A0A0M0BS06_9ARCH|nr:MAG: hypothetical protein AC482_01580 [miscellaneous Crenarchaeota group-15 archaeon DG-45]
MTCLHLHPKHLRIGDWEQQQDIAIVVCLRCGKVLEIRLLGSQSSKTHEDEGKPPAEASVEIPC